MESLLDEKLYITPLSITSSTGVENSKDNSSSNNPISCTIAADDNDNASRKSLCYFIH